MADFWNVAGPIVLDGGLATALEDRGHDLSDALWSARLLKDAPGEIAEVHREFYRAGALVATTASYQSSVEGFEQAGLDRAEAERLIRSSVMIARDVRDEVAADGRHRWVAASVGPYGAVLANGSEYRGRYGIKTAALRDFHQPRLDLLASAGPDLLAVETIPDVEEADVLVALLDELGVPAWLSYSINGRTTRAGQPLEDAFAAAATSPVVRAVGVNCCTPGDVRDAVEIAKSVCDRPVVAYPNSGERWDAHARRWAGRSAYDPTLAQAWIAAGAQYVGGCCRVGPGKIAALARTVHAEP